MARPTITDIAKAAGVSTAAVSFALNGRPGVSDVTRARVLGVAAQYGWLPNVAARSLASSQVGAVGLVLARPAKTLGAEPFFMQLISGIERELSQRSVALVLQVVDDHAEEIAAYRRWWAEGRVDGVLVVDPYVDDDRVEPLRELAVPAVFTSVPRGVAGIGGVVTDSDGEMRKTLDGLYGLGHTRIARVAGSPVHDHVAARSEALWEWSAEHPDVSVQIVTTDYTAEQGAEATAKILTGERRPTAIIYDNDVMALSGLAVAQQLEVHVPDEVSLLAWDDSTMCGLSNPSITALRRDIQQMGAAAARCLLEVLDGGPITTVSQPSGELMWRQSTGPARQHDVH